MNNRLRASVLFITFFFYGFQFGPGQRQQSRRNLLYNQKVRGVYFPGIHRSTKSFQDIEALKSCPKECRLVRKRQVYKGVQIFGSRIVEQFLGRKKVVVMGRKVNLYAMGVVPYISREQALAMVAKKTGKKFLKVKLMIYPTQEQNHLVWMMDEDEVDSRLRVFFDAKEGKIVDSYNNLAHLEEVEGTGIGVLGNEQLFNIIFNDGLFQMISLNPRIETYQYSLEEKLPGRKITSVGPFFDYPSGVDAQGHTQRFLKLLRERFKRLSYDNVGSPVINTVDYSRVPGSPYPSAFWNGSRKIIFYGIGEEGRASPLSGALDIVAHEITHAITEKTSDLIYRDESGALSEAFSDIMGAYAEHRLDPENADWKIGEDIWTLGVDGDAMRYMNNPTLDGKSRDHYEDRYKGLSDGGGVHWNSGIVNLAFYLLVEGGVHPRRPAQRVSGIGWERAMDIFYKAYTELLPSSAKFVDARDATVLVARDFEQQTVYSVTAAWAAVGVGNLYDESTTQGTGENGGSSQEYSKVLISHLDVKIPDDNDEGIKHQLEVHENVRFLAVSVDIEHSYRGDLIVKVISPKSQTYALHRRDGGEQNDLKKTYRIKLAPSDSSVGRWALKVSDHSKRDEGVLKSWSISL